MSVTHEIREGYGTLFQRIYEDIPGTKYPDEHVQSVVPTTDGRVCVTSQTGALDSVRYFDSVVVACDFSRVECPAKTLPLEVDVTWFGSWLFTSTTKIETAAIQKHAGEVLAGNGTNAPVSICFREERITESGEHEYIYWAVYYADTNEAAQLDSHVIPYMQKTYFDGEQVGLNTLYHHVYEYNLRPSPESIRAGFRRQLDDLQGQGQIYYSGGLASHWDVDSIYEQVVPLMDRLVTDYRFTDNS